jgi:ubiquinone biosynthesis protein
MAHSLTMLRIPQYFRNLQRLGEIARVLVKHGFGDVVQRLELPNHLSGLRVFFTRTSDSDSHPYTPIATRLRYVCEELGPTFIKLSQLIATRPDVFPTSIVEEFRKLQDSAPPFPFSEVISRIEEELGSSPSNFFSSIEEEPIGAASIAQVHRATLLDGTKVVIKVQRPNLERITETDLHILLGLASLIEEQFPEMAQYNPRRLIEEFARSVRAERNFLREAQNLRQFKVQLTNEPSIIVPTLYSNFCTKRILVQSYLEGIRIDEYHHLSPVWPATKLLEQRKLLTALNNLVLRSIFEVGFFHGDPHPGNVLLTRDGKIGLIDFGSMGRLTKARQLQIIQFLLAAFNRDLSSIVRLLKENLITPLTLDEISLQTQFAEVIDMHLQPNPSQKGINMAALVGDIFEVARRYGIRPPPDLLIVGRVLTSLQAIASALEPAYDPIEIVRPYLINRYRQMLFSSETYLRHSGDLIHNYHQLVYDLPLDLTAILKRIAKGQFSLGIKHDTFPDLARLYNRLVNRILLTIIGIVFFFTGLSWINTTSISYFCFIMGGAAIVRVLIAIRRSGGL